MPTDKEKYDLIVTMLRKMDEEFSTVQEKMDADFSSVQKGLSDLQSQYSSINNRLSVLEENSKLHKKTNSDNDPFQFSHVTLRDTVPATYNEGEKLTPQKKYDDLSETAKKIFFSWIEESRKKPEGVSATELSESDEYSRTRCSGFLKMFYLLEFAEKKREGNEVKYRPNTIAEEVYSNNLT